MVCRKGKKRTDGNCRYYKGFHATHGKHRPENRWHTRGEMGGHWAEWASTFDLLSFKSLNGALEVKRHDGVVTFLYAQTTTICEVNI